jgi:RNA polymerase sigma-70 factor (ECF subfamily)
MQEVLRSVTNAIARLEYNPAKGSFRGWLFTITRNKVFNFLDSRRRHPRGTGDTGAHAMLAAQPDQTPGLEESWQEEYQRRLVALALQTIESEFQTRTWQAFRKTTIDGAAIAEISAELEMTAVRSSSPSKVPRG